MARKHRDSQLEVLNPVKPDPETVKKVKYEKSRKACKFCGTHHKFGKKDCPAFGKNCDYCKKSNHFRSVCLQRKADESSTESEEEEEEEEEIK
jgi:hypothetical protein